MKKILVLCIGNICRSPVAEGLLKKQLPDYLIQSAGISALAGYPADPLALEIALEHGIDISAHRAQQLAGWMLQDADLVLVMETIHQKQLCKQHPLSRGKIHRLGVLGAAGTVDIADPYRRPRQAFEQSHESIAHGVNQWVNRIVQLA